MLQHGPLPSLTPVVRWQQLAGAPAKLQTRAFSAAYPSDPVHAAQGAGAAQPRSETLEEVRSRIFGTHIGNGLRSGRKVLQKKLLGAKIAAYYPEDILKSDPFMPDLKAER